MAPTEYEGNTAFLLELFNPVTKEMEEADICKRLDVALDKAYDHLKAYNEILDNIDVSFNNLGEVEGIAFFDENGAMYTCITTYYVDRDSDAPKNTQITEACLGRKESLQQALFKIFKFN